MKTQLTQRNVKAATSKDALRPSMLGVYHDAEKARLVATDGHMMVIWPSLPHDADDGPDAVSAILPVEAFPTKQPERYRLEISAETVVTHNCESKATHPAIQEQYPNYAAVIPDPKDATFVIAVNLELFKRLHDAIPGKDKCVKLHFWSPHRAIVVTPHEVEDIDAFEQAVVMPCMMNRFR